MSHVSVFYATTHGQSRRIAERIAEVLQSEGHVSLAFEVTSEAARTYDWRKADGAVVAASLHAGSHQSAADAFVREHLPRLNAIPCWFVSVSLSAASRNENERAAADGLAQAFATSSGWLPRRVSCVAGRLAYTQYSMVTRWLMRRIASKEGGPTDTSRDHELTDWTAVDTLAREFARDVWQNAGVAFPDQGPSAPAASRMPTAS